MKKCPKCNKWMFELEKNWIRVDKCHSCKWLFLDFMELKNFIDSVDKKNIETVETIYKWDFRKDRVWREYSCASCNSEMTEREFNYWSWIHIDFCRWCGSTFLWEWELEEILDHEYSRIYSIEWRRKTIQVEQMGQRVSMRQWIDYKKFEENIQKPFIARLFDKFFE